MGQFATEPLGLGVFGFLTRASEKPVELPMSNADCVGSGFQPRGSDFGFDRYFWKMPTACLHVTLPHTCMSYVPAL